MADYYRTKYWELSIDGVLQPITFTTKKVALEWLANKFADVAMPEYQLTKISMN